MPTSKIHISTVRAGDTLVADDGFTCMEAGKKLIRFSNLGPYIDCSEGKHFLDGQTDREGFLIGLTKSRKE